MWTRRNALRGCVQEVETAALGLWNCSWHDLPVVVCLASELLELLLHHTAPGQAFLYSGCVTVKFSFRDEIQGLVSGQDFCKSFCFRH